MYLSRNANLIPKVNSSSTLKMNLFRTEKKTMLFRMHILREKYFYFHKLKDLREVLRKKKIIRREAYVMKMIMTKVQ